MQSYNEKGRQMLDVLLVLLLFAKEKLTEFDFSYSFA